MIELTEQQQRVLGNGSNPRFVNPATNEEFVLVPAPIFDRIQLLLADDWSDAGFAAAMEAFAKAGWDDPAMDVYNSLDPRAQIMNVARGDVVLVDFPYPNGTGTKVRPALIIQNNRDNLRLLNTIVVQITSTTHRALEATKVLVELNTPEGKQAGIRSDSVVNCANVVTLSKDRVIAKIGDLPHAKMHRVKESLKVAMELH